VGTKFSSSEFLSSFKNALMFFFAAPWYPVPVAFFPPYSSSEEEPKGLLDFIFCLVAAPVPEAVLPLGSTNF
jgi:hypothetical protein